MIGSGLIRNFVGQVNTIKAAVLAVLLGAGGAGLIGYGAVTVKTVLDAAPVFPEQFDDGVLSVAQYLQDAVDYAAAQGRPLCIDRVYEVDVPIYVPSGSRWVGSGTIRNTYAGATNINKLCIVPGNYSPSEYAGLVYVGCAAAAAGQRFVTTSVAANAAGFAADDLVFVRSVEFYTGSGGVTLPLYGCMNRVRSINAATGLVELEFPILDAVANVQIAKANTATLDIFGTRTLYCCYGASIDGITLESVNGNALERGGFLNCDFRFKEIRGLTGIFTNAVCFSRVAVGAIICDQKPVDLAGCSVGSLIDVGAIAYRKTTRSANGVLVALNENALHNTLTICTLAADQFDYASQSLVQVGAASDNTVRIGTIACGALVGSPVIFDNVARAGGGQTQSGTKRNTVSVGSIVGGATLQRFAFFVNAGGQNEQNSLEIVASSGVVSASAVTLAGDGHKVRGRFGSGAVSLGASTNCNVDAVAPAALVGFTRASGNSVRLNGVDYTAAPTVRASVIHAPAAINGGGGASTFTPNVLNGGLQLVSFTSSTAFTLNFPTNLAAGDEFDIEVKNSNGATGIVPALAAGYVAGAALVSIAAGRSSLLRFKATTAARVLVTPVAQDYAG